MQINSDDFFKNVGFDESDLSKKSDPDAESVRVAFGNSKPN